MTFGSLLRQLRNQRGMVLPEFSRKLNISPRLYAAIENDEIDITYKDFCKVVKILKLTDREQTQLKILISPSNSVSELAEKCQELAVKCPALAEEMERVEEILRVFFAHYRVWKRHQLWRGVEE
jgi:transcriptional regulator with XRE-family HTH domain